MSRLRRVLALAVLTTGLLATAATAQVIQPMEGEEEPSRGKPIYGYVATAFLGAGAIFVLCNSSRR